MRTNIVIDDQLVADAMKLSGVKTKREVVELALRRLVTAAKQKDILDLVGQDMIAPDYDVRAVRSRMAVRYRRLRSDISPKKGVTKPRHSPLAGKTCLANSPKPLHGDLARCCQSPGAISPRKNGSY